MNELDSRLRAIQQKIDRAIGIYGLQVNPPLAESEIIRIEQRHKIIFPTGYRFFITKIANGMAGGLFSLQESLAYLERESQACTNFLKTPFMHTAAYNPDEDPKILQLEAEFNQRRISKAEFNSVFSYLTAGTMIIAHSGCSYYERLVITGATRGQIWGDGDISGRGFMPRNLQFLDWYERCLQRIF